jgi:hypothetical protein
MTDPEKMLFYMMSAFGLAALMVVAAYSWLGA